MKAFAHTCRGQSHIASGKPCQDYSYASTRDGVSIAVVCDGHGGDRYFRSDVGSRLCTEITVKAISTFVDDVNNSLFVGKPLTRRKVVSEMGQEKLTAADNALRQLFSAIIAGWYNAIEDYTISHPITPEERAKAKPEHIEAFERNINLEKTYGCTLMAYVKTPQYWFAFHIGDGKCVSFNAGDQLWQEPIEWDERCFLNKTTSICDSNALNEMRYTYCGDGSFPVAIYLGSDGLDDSFGPMENLVDFYMQLTKMLAREGELPSKKSVIETLPVLSRRGSQDDMSLAYVYDPDRLYLVVRAILEHQISKIQQNISSLSASLEAAKTKYNSLLFATARKDEIERNYAKKDIDRFNTAIANERRKLAARLEELHPSSQNIRPAKSATSRIPSKILRFRMARKSKR